jgi:ribosomal protein S6--L-glutamate ligase
MKLVVLSRSRRISSTKRLVEAARARGHAIKVLNPLDVELYLDSDQVELLHHRKRVGRVDVVIPRIAASIASYGLPVVDQFETRGAKVLNSARAIGQSRNPARCLQILASSGLSIPATVMARDAKELLAMVGLVGGMPVLVKLLEGAERRGLMVCESEQSLEAALEAVLGLGHNIVMQEYVKRTGRDVRVFVIGGTAVAAVTRVPKPGRLSRTLSRIARLEPLTPSDEIRAAAEKAATICGLEVCAVDLLDLKKSAPKVFEVNASPSLPEMELATGVDLAAAIIARAEVIAAGS